MAKTWVVNIKWDGSNNVDEASRLMEIQITRGRKKFLRGEGFEPNAVGECVMTFRNNDGRYDPLNSGSAIYPNCAPGKLVTITLTDGSTYNMFKGYIYDLQPIGNAQSERVRIVAKDGWQWLKDRKVRAAAQTNYRTDQAISALATAADYPFTVTVDTAVDTIPYWWADNKDAASAIHEASDSEMGIVYINGSGALIWKNKSYRYNALTTGSTWTETDINEISFAQPWEVVRNVTQVKVYPTDVIINQVLWQSSKVFKLRPSKSITLNVRYTYQGEQTSATAIATMVPSTDYRAFANANGSGSNLTASIGVVLTAKGEEAQLVLTNNHATRTAFITYLQVRGNVINETDEVIVEKDTSGGTNRRTFLVDTRWRQDVEKAQLYADYLARYLDDVRAAPVVRSNRSTAKQCEDLYTEITLNLTTLGISSVKYRIAGVEHKWNAQSYNVLDSKLYLEAKDNSSYWIVGTSTFDSETILAF